MKVLEKPSVRKHNEAMNSFFIHLLKVLHQTDDHLIGRKVLKAFLYQIQLSSSCPVVIPVGGGGCSHLKWEERNTLRNT